MFDRLALPLIIALLALTTGCASMYNPLTPGFREDQHPIVRDCAFPSDYQSGVKCAQRVQDKYLEAATADAIMSDRFFVAMVPISLAAVGVGIAGGSGNAITGLALASATGLGWGTWLTSKTRRELYGLGAQAINCVITASGPLDISTARLNDMKTHAGDLRSAQAELTAAIGNISKVERLKDSDELKEAKELHRKADEFLRLAEEALGIFDRSGLTIWNAAMDVHTRVVSAQVKNANDLRDFSEHLQGSVYGTFQDVIGLASVPSKFGKKKDKSVELQGFSPDDQALVNTLVTPVKNVRDAITKVENDLQSVHVADLNPQFIRLF